MELRQLRYFVAVAREQNFTRAAKQLNIAQPPLSRQIQQFEEELGVELIRRNTRPAYLTEAGKLLYEQALQILERVEETKAMMNRLKSAERPRFSIGFVGSTLYGKLPEVIRRYRDARPEVEAALVELTSLEQIAALKEGRIDVGFGRIPHGDPAITRHLLRNERLVAVLPLNHRLLDRPGALRLSDFAGDTLVAYPRVPRPSYADQVLALFRAQDITLNTVMEVRELHSALGLVAAQAGMTIVPAGVRQLRRDGVAYHDLEDEGAISPIIMSHRKGDISPEIGVVMGLIRDIYLEEGIAFGE